MPTDFTTLNSFLSYLDTTIQEDKPEKLFIQVSGSGWGELHANKVELEERAASTHIVLEKIGPLPVKYKVWEEEEWEAAHI